MKLRILDTDMLSLFLHGHPQVCKRIGSIHSNELAVTIIAVEEILTGWYAQIRRARRDDQFIRAYASLQEAVEFFRFALILAFDQNAISEFHSLRRQHRRHGPNDLRIAAIALTRDGIVVTRNQNDFGAVDGLTTEDWSTP